MREGVYHLSVQLISRADRAGGRSVVAAAAYRSAMKLSDERYKKVHNYTRKQNVVFSEIMLPDGAPERFADREFLWNEVEKSETRKNSRLAREIDIALPKSLPLKEQIKLAQNFVQEQFVDQGMIADLCLHNEEHNPHFHVLLTTREVTADGFGKKVRDWDKRDLLLQWREAWAKHCNEALKKNEINEFIDHRSYKDRGINKTPQIKLGPQRAAMLKKGIDLDSLARQKEYRRQMAELEEAEKRAKQQAARIVEQAREIAKQKAQEQKAARIAEEKAEKEKAEKNARIEKARERVAEARKRNQTAREQHERAKDEHRAAERRNGAAREQHEGARDEHRAAEQRNREARQRSERSPFVRVYKKSQAISRERPKIAEIQGAARLAALIEGREKREARTAARTFISRQLERIAGLLGDATQRAAKLAERVKQLRARVSAAREQHEGARRRSGAVKDEYQAATDEHQAAELAMQKAKQQHGAAEQRNRILRTGATELIKDEHRKQGLITTDEQASELLQQCVDALRNNEATHEQHEQAHQRPRFKP